MPRAVLNGTVVAESEDTVVVEGNHYFPPEAVKQEHLAESDRHTVCGWKGTASYYDVVVDGEVVPAAAWYYPDTTDAAKHIEGRIAFWRGVKVEA